MESESGYAGFKMEGKNSGASMYIRSDDDLPRKLQDGACCINIYVNNNVQGVNNSILAESQVTMKNPGVAIYLKFVERWNQKRKRSVSKRKCRTKREDVVKKKKKSSGSGSKLGLVGFPGMLVFLGTFFLVSVFLSLT
ncbi:unnamed protein product [Linum tenue]|uniref:Uncharacterized protein n=1 Tax=Linum tenue TaxID=586396 RepID=A0AAV0HKT1_9ROSI|nr:unnamed protein product [Linum tenue]